MPARAGPNALWLDADAYDVIEAWSHNLSPQLRREIRRIVFDHFDYIAEQWHQHVERHRETGN